MGLQIMMPRPRLWRAGTQKVPTGQSKLAYVIDLLGLALGLVFFCRFEMSVLLLERGEP